MAGSRGNARRSRRRLTPTAALLEPRDRRDDRRGQRGRVGAAGEERDRAAPQERFEQEEADGQHRHVNGEEDRAKARATRGGQRLGQRPAGALLAGFCRRRTGDIAGTSWPCPVARRRW
jgi:hypothetical protein